MLSSDIAIDVLVESKDGYVGADIEVLIHEGNVCHARVHSPCQETPREMEEMVV